VLKAIHGTFRRELALIRAEVAASGPRLGSQLGGLARKQWSGRPHLHACGLGLRLSYSVLQGTGSQCYFLLVVSTTE
jgi:hypothetical protein